MCEIFQNSILQSPFGQMRLDWVERGKDVCIRRLWLIAPVESEDQRSINPSDVLPESMERVIGDIQKKLSGENVQFSLELLDWGVCSEFQQRVLRAEHAIPHGRVSSYGRIAAHLGKPGGARAVGRALATNPFPLIIPCHRAVRGNGELGGFQGGLAMKRSLLEMEGVSWISPDRVGTNRFWY